LMHETQQACRDVETYLKAQYEAFLETTGFPQRQLSWDIDVTTYADFIQELHDRGIDTQSVIEQTIAEEQDAEALTLSFKETGAVDELDADKRVYVIMYVESTCLTNNYLKESDPSVWQMKSVLQQVLKNHETKTGESCALKKISQS